MQQLPKWLRLLIWIVVIVLLAAIFLLSDQPASQSGALSKKIARNTIHLYEAITQKEISLAQWNRMLRKGAHFSLYCILAFFIMTLCKFNRIATRTSIIITMIVGISYAIFDELHQLFVDGRGASIKDVGIDSLGIGLGIVIAYLINRSWLK